MRIKVECSYNGSAFHGWARQKGQRTVEGEIERAFFTILRSEIKIQAAGRTDAGVHAAGQVFHADLPNLEGRLADFSYLMNRMNCLLEKDVVLRKVEPAPLGFDARFSALGRTYVYRASPSRSARSLIFNGFAWDLNFAPDLNLLNFLASSIVGLKDFASFALPNPGGTTIRRVEEARWEKAEEGPEKGLIRFTIRADAFARKMVRFLVGGQICVAAKKKPASWFLEKFSSSRDFPPLAPACGLTLEKVDYPRDELLEERSRVTRAVRHRDELSG
ncbi:MAG: tRNA pseudouridine synthase A [Aeriscardovia sp.]|nr:tRNA pseudouridine synthase A [Aeriscardovia sp.]